MNNNLLKILLSSFMLLCVSSLLAQSNNEQVLTIKNNSANNISDYIVEIPVEKLNLKLGEYIAVWQNETSPVEIVTDVQGNTLAIFCIENFNANQVAKYTIKKGSADAYPKRTYAGLAHKIGGQFVGKEYIGGNTWIKVNRMVLPGTFTDHSYYIKHEGPGWENDKIAFRFYLDNRNAIDAFGKTTSELVLPTVGACDFDAYHNLAFWGMDNSKVSKSLGLGSIAIWDGEKAVRVEKKDSTTCLIASDGKLRSQVKTTYHGWLANGEKCNLTSLISIDAGSYTSHMELVADKKLDNLTTGIIKDPSGKLIVNSDKNKEWSYIATFGKQSVNKDRQGLAIFVKTKQIKQITEDDLNHILILQPDKNGYADYYFMSTWELEKDPIKTEKEFVDRINLVLNKLENNISISYK